MIRFMAADGRRFSVIYSRSFFIEHRNERQARDPVRAPRSGVDRKKTDKK